MNSSNAFVSRKSLVHKINPALKVLIFAMFIAMIFMPIGFVLQIILIAFLTGTFLLARLPFRMLWNILKSVLFLFIVLFIINWFIYKEPLIINVPKDAWWIGPNNGSVFHSPLWGGEIKPFTNSNLAFINQAMASFKNPDFSKVDATKYLNLFNNNADISQKVAFLVSKGHFKINGVSWTIMEASNMFIPNIATESTLQNAQIWCYTNNWYTLSPKAIELALYISIKVGLIIISATLLTSTTNSIQLTNAFEDLFSPLRFLRFPVNEVSMMISIALRFIPSLLSESRRIMNAQASRGVDFRNGNIKDKTKSLISLVVPLFSIAFKKAEELANAMDARAYNPRYIRTRYRNFYLKYYDWITFFIISFLLGIFISLVSLNVFFADFGYFEAGALYK